MNYEMLKIVPYDYQIESFKHCVSNNTLLVLATGMGKTLISILTLLELKKIHEESNRNNNSNKVKVALFLVDRIPLVVQQAEAISDISGLRVLQCYGDTSEQKRLKIKEMKDYDVLVANAQSLINLIKNKYFSMENVYFLVFDEVHHAAKEHPFNEAMKFVNFLPFSNRPRILGMSASICSEDTVGKNIDKIKSMEQKFMNSQVFRPTLLLFSSFTSQKNEIVIFDSYVQEQVFSDKLADFIKNLVKQFVTKIEGDIDIDLDDISNHNRYVYGLRKLAMKFEKNDRYTKILELIIKMCGVLTIIKVEGVKKALCELEKTLEISSIGASVMDPIYKALNVQDYKDPIIKEFSSRYSKFQDIFDKNYNEFLKEPNATTDIDNQFRAIVFVDTRYAADRLLSQMSQDPKFYNLKPRLFVGHGGNDGMTSDQQQTMITLFKKGECRILVATNVLEEGLDIKDCNLVICYDGIFNLKSLIQKRGRARSTFKSKFFILTNKEGSKSVETLVKKENSMILAINKLVNERKEISNNLNLVANLKDFSYDSIVKKSVSNNIKKVFFISLYHIDIDNAEDDIAATVYGSFDYTLLEIKRVMIPSNEEFMQFCYFMAIEYVGNKSLTVHQMICEVLEFLSPYDWWCKIPNHLDNTFNSDNLIKDATLIQPTNLQNILDNLKVPLQNGNGKLKNPIIELPLRSLEFGNFYHPTRFSKKSQLNISGYKKSIFKMFKREFQIQHEDRTYFFSYTDLHPYCIFTPYSTPNNTINGKELLEFYLPVIRPGKITRKHSPFPDKQTTIRSHPPNELKFTYGTSFVYRFSLELSQKEVENLKSKLIKYGFELFYGKISIVDEPKALNYEGIKNSSIVYLFDCLQTNLTFGMPCYNQDFINYIVDMCNGRQSEKAIFILKEAIQNKILFYDLRKLIDNMKDRLDVFFKSTKFDIDSPMKEVKLVVMTPSRTVFNLPTLIQTNRVIRKFDSQRFMLFHFQDDRNQKLSYLGPDLKKLLEDVIVKSGINVSGSTYKFLGGSQSQMKNIGCWLYNDSETAFNTFKVREWMGHIPKFPRKFLRSMGILFSSTTVFRPIAANQIIEINEPEDRSQFTEGCGTIGMDLVNEINKNLGFPIKTCSFQIRFGGYKGVVSIDPNPDYRDKLRLRKSMKKFETESDPSHRTLEIISISSSKTCNLSRPLITLLSGIGAKDSYFLDLFHDKLTNITKPLNNIEAARKQLSDHFPGVTDYELLTDNYLRRIQILYYKKQLGDLQQRFNMEILNSRNLLGIADETSTLEPNTVFINITTNSDDGIKTRKVITGNVGVTRNPSTHPGDIRFLTAVNNPILESLYSDVIVFSVKGKIPNFKESSGGDLDGDRYFVFFDKTLIDDCKQEDSSGFQDKSSPNEEKDENILGNETLGKQFCSNLQKSYIGDIANDHLAICDSLSPKDAYAIELSRLHFQEVDVVKHGEHACIPQPIKNYLNSNGYPHFMKKGHDSKRTYYKSEKVLGTMYDQCSQLDFIGDIIPDIDIDKELIIPGHEEYMKDAQEQYLIYKNSIHNLLKRHNAKTEEELTLGFFENPVTNFVHTNDSKENAHTQFKRIREYYTTIFLTQFTNQDQKVEELLIKFSSQIEKKISAWYKVAYSDSEEDRTLSFYWNIKNLQKKPIVSHEIEKYTLSRSIQDYFLSEIKSIEKQYIERINLLNILNEKIINCRNLKGSKLDFIGSTCLLLFDKYSDINLIYIVENSNTPSENLQRSYLDRLSDELLSIEGVTNKHYDGNILKLSIKKTQITITMDISQYKLYKLYLQHIFNHPFLLPFLLIITQWAKASYLIKSNIYKYEEVNRKTKHSNIKCLTVPSIVHFTIAYCLDQMLINNINENSLDVQNTSKGWGDWKILINSSIIDQRKVTIGQKILDFLNFNNKYLLDRLTHKDNQRILYQMNLKDITTNSIQFYQETFLVGYHSLSHSKNIEKFFESCSFTKKYYFPIKNNIFDKLDELQMKLNCLMHFKYSFQPSIKKPKKILLEGNPRTLSEAVNIIRSVINSNNNLNIDKNSNSNSNNNHNISINNNYNHNNLNK